ncbi:MaoC/PaaZ C-terminal domain-containing protein [Variovorax sp. LARHSF232]
MSEFQAPPPASQALAPGFSFESAGRTVTESDIVAFACLSGDYNRIHVDGEYAKTTAFGRRIAHGLLVLSILSGLTTQSSGYRALEPNIIALKELTCRFPKPTFIGDTIHVKVTVVEKSASAKPGRSEVTFRREAINQRGEVVVQADFKMLMREETAT